MHHPDDSSALKTQKRFWFYSVWSVLSVLALFLLPNFWHSPYHAPGYFDAGALILVIAVSAVCLWTFLNCPFRHWFVKIVTFLSLLVALFYAVLIVGLFLFPR